MVSPVEKENKEAQNKPEKPKKAYLMGWEDFEVEYNACRFTKIEVGEGENPMEVALQYLRKIEASGFVEFVEEISPGKEKPLEKPNIAPSC